MSSTLGALEEQALVVHLLLLCSDILALWALIYVSDDADYQANGITSDQ